MDRIKLCLVALASTAAFSLAACGGDGPRVAATPPPPPPPEPPPPPAIAEFVEILPLTESRDLVTLDQEGTIDATQIRYDADRGAYFIQLPFGDEDAFLATYEDEFGWSGTLADIDDKDDRQNISVGFSKPEYQGTQYTVRGSAYDEDDGIVTSFIVGIPTLAEAMPVTGSATYEASGYGESLYWYVTGTAIFDFDFAIGSLTGHYDATLLDGWGGEVPIGTYDFVDTVFSVGATDFSGGFLNAETMHQGSFFGLFTGPSAEELMAYWTLTFSDPYQEGGTDQARGTWIGVRQ